MGYIERCLYDYKANVAKLEMMQEELDDLMSLHGQSYEIFKSHGEADPVANAVNQRLKLEIKIKEIKRRIKPVEKLIEDLKGTSLRVRQMAEILRLRYFQHEDKTIIMEKLAVSSSTLWRRTNELIALAERYFPLYMNI